MRWWFSLVVLFLLTTFATAQSIITYSKHGSLQPLGRSGVCTINAVNFSNNNFPGGSASGTSVGVAGVTTSGSCAAPSWSISGTDAASFQMSGSTLQTNGVVVGNLNSRSINLVATITGAAGSPFTQAESVTGLFPGQTGFDVGYQAPGNPCGGVWTAHNTTFTSGTSGSHAVYQCLDVDAGTSGTDLSNVQFADFKYVRFQSNQVGFYNVLMGGTVGNITLDHVTVSPRSALIASPPGSTWPSAGSGSNVFSCTSGVNCGNGNNGYQYGFRILACSGPISITNSDIWGFGNSIDLHNTTCQITIEYNWIHDAVDAVPQAYHTDGPGFLEGTTPPQNVTVDYNTIASLGNTNAIALQAATSGYVNILMNGNFFSGFNAMIDPGHCTAGSTGLQFEDNTIGTHIQWQNSIIYCDTSSLFTGGGSGTWQRNKLYFLAGTANNTGAIPAWTSSDNGKFIKPNNTLSATDY